MTTKEEVPVGTVIGKLEAIDEDIGDNAAIDYAITGSTWFNYKSFFVKVILQYQVYYKIN